MTDFSVGRGFDESMFRAILDSMGDGVSIQDTSLRVLYQNEAHKAIVGDHRGEYCFSAYQHRDSVCRDCLLVRSFADGLVHTAERSTVQPSGTVHVEITTSPVRDENGQIVAGIEVVRNITKRKRIERDLAEKTKNLAVLLNLSKKLTSTTDLQALYRLIVSLSKAMLDLDFSTLMLAAPDGKGLMIRDTVGFPESMIGTFQLLEGQGLSTLAYATRHPLTVLDFSTEDRFEVPAVVREMGITSAICTPMMIEEDVFGVLIGHTLARREFTSDDVFLYQNIGNISAITVRNVLNQKLILEARNEWEDTFNTIRDAISIHDRQFNILRANAAARQFMGLPDEIPPGKKCFHCVHEASCPPEHCPAVKTLRTGRPVAREIFEPRLNVFLEIHTFPRHDAQGAVIGFIHTARDITQRKKSEDEQKKLQEQLFQAQKMESVGQLAGGVAHDFNNILSVIIGYCEMLLMRLPPGAPSTKEIGIIKESGERAAALANQLLAFSRKQIMKLETVRLNPLVVNMSRMLGRMIGEDIKLAIHANAPRDTVRVDTVQIEQVLLNLVVNARDAMPAGGCLTIETHNVDLNQSYARTHEGVVPGHYLVMAVTDTGIGMTPELVKNIFNPFFTTKERGRGTGLGLAMVFGIIKQHGGHIHVYSEPGVGSAFRIYLPVAAEAEADKHPVPFFRHAHGTETVLVVDDEPDLRTLVRDVLESLGYKVLVAADGPEAIRTGEAFPGPIHALLTDVIMPGMSGKTLADTLASNRPDLRVIYMSGYSDNVLARHGVLDPETVLIEKPLTMAKLAGTLREVLGKA